MKGGLAIVVSPRGRLGDKAPKSDREPTSESDEGSDDKKLALDEIASILGVPDAKKSALSDALELFMKSCPDEYDE